MLLKKSITLCWRQFSVRRFTTDSDLFRQEQLHQDGPRIQLANRHASLPDKSVIANFNDLNYRPYLAGSNGQGFPKTLDYATHDDCDSFKLSGDPSPQSLGHGLSALVNSSLHDKGALLVRGLDKVISSNKEFSQMVELMGEKFAYTAGLATRKEFDDAPGVFVMIQNNEKRKVEYFKVLWRRQMTLRRQLLSLILRCHTTERCQVTMT